MNLDAVDRQILAVLRRDARTSNVELAREVGLTPTPCLRRVRRLEREKIIRGYHADIDASADNRQLRAVIGVRLGQHQKSVVAKFRREIANLDNIDSILHVTGNFDYLVLASVADLPAYEKFHAEHLTNLPGVVQVMTYIVMDEVV